MLLVKSVNNSISSLVELIVVLDVKTAEAEVFNLVTAFDVYDVGEDFLVVFNKNY